jgi:hypothetical protein
MNTRISWATEVMLDIQNAGGVDAIEYIHGSMDYYLRFYWFLDKEDIALVKQNLNIID